MPQAEKAGIDLSFYSNSAIDKKEKMWYNR
jgi:hypothetical protein